MTPEEQNPHPSVHHQTIRGARLALARKGISQESYRAVLRGELSLADAKEHGRGRGPDAPVGNSGQDEAVETPGRTSAEDAPDTPPQPVSRISKDDRSRLCLCSCGRRTKGGRFLPGHDVRMVTLGKGYVHGEVEPTEEQMEYLRESGKLDRARKQVEKE
jgi:hypothetical protein